MGLTKDTALTLASLLGQPRYAELGSDAQRIEKLNTEPAVRENRVTANRLLSVLGVDAGGAVMLELKSARDNASDPSRQESLRLAALKLEGDGLNLADPQTIGMIEALAANQPDGALAANKEAILATVPTQAYRLAGEPMTQAHLDQARQVQQAKGDFDSKVQQARDDYDQAVTTILS